MKKVLIGVGIGCGVLLLVGVLMAVGGAWWAKGKLENVAEAGKAMEAQGKQLASLNDKYPFTSPPKGQPVALSDARLQEYLAIRASILPVYKKYEEQAKSLDHKNGQQADLGDAMKAMGLLSGLMKEVRAKSIEQLDAHKMAPREFHAITAAIYSPAWGQAGPEMRKAQRQNLAGMKEMYEKQLADPHVPDEMKASAKEGLETVNKQLADLPAEDGPTEAEKLHLANSKLVEKYKVQSENDRSAGFDIFLIDDKGDSLGEAFENAGVNQGEDDSAQDDSAQAK
ncbi:MAG: hypothetical protein ACXU86_04645 [Archangium sp.]